MTEKKTAEEILGGGMYADQIGNNIEVVSKREAILAMNEYAAQELADHKAVIEELIPLAEFTKFKTAKDIEIINRARKLIKL